MTAFATTAPSTEDHGFHRWLVRGLTCVLGFYVVYMNVLAWFKQDETEAVHTAWKVLHGELIYVDFFQHHHPLLYVYLAPIIALCGERAATVVICRMAILPFFFGIVAATWLLARRLFDARTALVAAACLLMSWPFLYFATQIRPDVPEVMLGTIALAMLYARPSKRGAGVRGGDAPGAAMRQLLCIGLCLGGAFLFLQKAVFYFAAVTLILVARIFRGKAGWKALFALGAGIVLAVLPLAIWLAAHGTEMVRQYFFLNWTLNACCLDRFSFVPFGIAIVETQPAVCVFALLGLAALSLGRRHGELATAAAVLLCGVLFAPAPYLHYWIPLLPLLAIYAAHGLVRTLGRWPAVLGGILAANAIAPIIVNAVIWEGPNFAQLKQITYVLEATEPSDTVHDGDILFNVFRKDIDYFWFSLGDRQMLGTYRSLRGYDLPVCDRIDKLKPKIISKYKIEDLNDPRIREHYAESERYPQDPHHDRLTPELFVRKQ